MGVHPRVWHLEGFVAAAARAPEPALRLDGPRPWATLKRGPVMKAVLLLLALGLLLLPLRAEDWTTTTGETYKNVKVLSHDAAYVTILHEDGGGKIPLSTLSPDIQKRFDYDPAKAAQAIAAADAKEKQNRLALAQEKARIQAARQKAAADALTAALFAPPPDVDVPPAGTPNGPPPEQPPGLVAGYEIPNPPVIDYSDDGDYGDFGYGGYGYGYPVYGYGYGGYGNYGNRGYHGGWNRNPGTRSFSPGAYRGGTGYPGRH